VRNNFSLWQFHSIYETALDQNNPSSSH